MLKHDCAASYYQKADRGKQGPAELPEKMR